MSEYETAQPDPVEAFLGLVNFAGPLSEHRPDLGPCWLWIGPASGKERYGRVPGTGRTTYAHRVSYELFVGPIPAGLQIDHLCRVRPCVNPSHLEPVTSRENTLRAVLLKTHCPRGHPYEGSNLKLVAGRLRNCRECHREFDRRRYWRLRPADVEMSRAGIAHAKGRCPVCERDVSGRYDQLTSSVVLRLHGPLSRRCAGSQQAVAPLVKGGRGR